MRHKMLTQRTFFAITCNTKKYAESAFCDACHNLLCTGGGGGGGGVL